MNEVVRGESCGSFMQLRRTLRYHGRVGWLHQHFMLTLPYFGDFMRWQWLLQILYKYVDRRMPVCSGPVLFSVKPLWSLYSLSPPTDWIQRFPRPRGKVCSPDRKPRSLNDFWEVCLLICHPTCNTHWHIHPVNVVVLSHWKLGIGLLWLLA